MSHIDLKASACCELVICDPAVSDVPAGQDASAYFRHIIFPGTATVELILENYVPDPVDSIPLYSIVIPEGETRMVMWAGTHRLVSVRR